MRIHYLQHVPYENIGNIQAWAVRNGHSVSKTVLYYDEALPEVDRFDFLVIMGGAMNVYEEKDYPWLAREKKFLKAFIDAGKPVLGICLGAQLIADAMGGKVTKNPEKEIGWFDVTLSTEAKASPVFKAMPSKFMAFHWHGDTFSIPPGAKPMASSAACANQAFEANGGKVIGLQFHLEVADDGISRIVKSCGTDLAGGKFVQKKEQLLGQNEKLKDIYGNLGKLLDAMEKACKL